MLFCDATQFGSMKKLEHIIAATFFDDVCIIFFVNILNYVMFNGIRNYNVICNEKILGELL